jgi:hypothetical protein
MPSRWPSLLTFARGSPDAASETVGPPIRPNEPRLRPIKVGHALRCFHSTDHAPIPHAEMRIKRFLHRIRSSPNAVLHYDSELRDLSIWYW